MAKPRRNVSNPVRRNAAVRTPGMNDTTEVPEDECLVVWCAGNGCIESGLVLDAGCGAGRPLLKTMAERHSVVGLDISTEQIATARERVPDAGFVQGDLANLSFADNAFDAIASYHAIILRWEELTTDEQWDAAVPILQQLWSHEDEGLERWGYVVETALENDGE